MKQNMVKLNDAKLVMTWQPSIPAVDGLIGREKEKRETISAWLGGNSPLLYGPPGVGKTRIIDECARALGKDSYTLQSHDDLSPEDVVCKVRFSDDRERKMDYILAEVSTAALLGQVVCADEIGKMRRKALAIFNSLLDHRRFIDSTVLGERIYAHPEFCFAAATNTTDLDREPLPDWMKDRLKPVIEVGYPEREEIDQIIGANFPRLEDIESLLNWFWELWADRLGDTPATPRDALQVFQQARGAAIYEAYEEYLTQALQNRNPCLMIKKKHLVEAFDAFNYKRRSP
jgi:MoxR-like ATPase